MHPVICILDTNVIVDRLHHLPQVLNRLSRVGEAGHALGLCDPGYTFPRKIHGFQVLFRGRNCHPNRTTRTSTRRLDATIAG